MHQNAKITEHMLEFGWGEGWGIKLIWLTWWNPLLLRCEPLPCHEDFDSKNTEETRPKQITGEKTTAGIQYGGGTRRLGNRSPDSDLRFCQTPPLISACSHLRIPWMCSPMRSTKKQGEGIIIARGGKKHLEIKHSCGQEKKQGCGFERREHGSCTHLQRSSLPPSVPWFQMTLARGSRCNKSEMNRTCSRGVDAANGAQKRQPPTWWICTSIPSEMLLWEPGCVHGWWWIREKWPPAEESEEP